MAGGIGVVDGAAPHREHKDHSLRWLFTHLRNPSLRGFGLDCPAVVEARSPVMAQVETNAVVVDALLVGEDGSVWHLEFEMGTASPCRLIEHHVAVVRAHPERAVETVVFWGRPRTGPPAVRCGRATLAARHVVLAEMDGAAELARLRAKVGAGGELGSDDTLKLAMLPLMGQGRPVWEVLREAVPVAEALEPELRRGVVGAMGALAYGALEPGRRPLLLEVLRQMPVGEELFEVLRQEGERQGEVRMAREAVLDAFLARFDRVPAAVAQAVADTEDPAQLKGWLRAVIRAGDAAVAEAVFAARH